MFYRLSKDKMTQNLEERFDELAEDLIGSALCMSETTGIVRHPAYREIIAMGEEVIPLIFKRYNNFESEMVWYDVLSNITNEDPIIKKMKDMGMETLPENHCDFMNSCLLEWGREKGYVENKVMEIKMTEIGNTVEDEFSKLKEKLKWDTLVSSNPQDVLGHPAYKSIIALGKEVLPFMLENLTSEEYLIWADALMKITGCEPPFEAYGITSSQKYADWWVNWGKENNYL